MQLNKFLIVYLLSVFLSFSHTANAEDDDRYKVSTDDEISITVFDEPGLSIERIKIGTEGLISMPLIGKIKVKGLTLAEIELQIINRLLDGYLKKPTVTVTITEYRPFYISGEVKEPGSYPYRKGLTVQKAISLAGGFTDRAARKSISLVGEIDKRNVKAVSLNDTVNPGDVITISESFF